MPTVIVLAGGTSSEREVSLRSGIAVSKALQDAYTVVPLDPVKPIADYGDTLRQADVVFPALHGLHGEDGIVQQYLEGQSLSFVGTPSDASALCFDKYRYGEFLQHEGILVPETELVDKQAYLDSSLSRGPHVLKPNDGGSSVDTVIVREPGMANLETIDSVFAIHEKMLLQTLITGIEITVGILGSKALPVIQIIPPADGEFDYENKYNGQTQELCPPPDISLDVQTEAQALAVRIHELTGCRDMSRTDMIITTAGKIYVLETNTIPGLTDQSLLPKAAAAVGISMPEMCGQLVQAALSR